MNVQGGGPAWAGSGLRQASPLPSETTRSCRSLLGAPGVDAGSRGHRRPFDDPAVDNVRERVEFTVDGALNQRQEKLPGVRGNPMDEEAFSAMFHECARRVLAVDRADALYDRLATLDELADPVAALSER